MYFEKKRLIFLLCLLTSAHVSWAQSEINFPDQNLYVKSYSVQDGLSDNNVNTIYRDQRGVIWIGTAFGLNKFNGYEFEVFKSDTSSHSLNNSNIRVIVEDKFADLWVGTLGGLHRYVPESNDFEYYPISENNIILDMFYDSLAHQLVLGTRSNDLIKFDIENKSILKEENLIPEGFGITRLIPITTDSIAVGTVKEGVFIVNLSTKKSNHYHKNSEFYRLSDNNIRSLTISDNNLYIGTDEGLNILNFKEEKIIAFNTGSTEIPSGLIVCSTKDINGNVWVGMDGGGLSIFDNNNFKTVNYNNQSQKQKRLHSGVIRDLHEDIEGNMWISTALNGFSVYNKHAGIFENQIVKNQEETEEQRIPIWNFTSKNDSILYVCTDGMGLLEWDGKKFERVRSLDGKKEIYERVLCTAFDDFGDLWIGTYSQGLFRLSKDGVLRQFNAENTPQLNNYIYSIVKDGRGQLWLATLLGLVRLDPKNLNFKRFLNLHPKGNEGDISHESMILSSDNKLWMSSYFGFLCFDPQEEKFIRHKFKAQDKYGLKNDFVTTVSEDHAGNIWIGTFGSGLQVYEPNSDQFVFEELTNLIDDKVVRFIKEDESHAIWVGTNSGIIRINPNRDDFNLFNVNHGMQDNTYCQNACIIYQDSLILAGGITGFSIIHPERMELGKVDPNLILENVIYKNDRLPFNPNNNEEIPSFEIYYSQSSIKITFSALDFFKTKNVSYSYFLENFDEEWSIPNKVRQASYTNLPPGQYNFIVNAIDQSNKKNKIKRLARIHVKPLWFMTLQFKIMVIIVLFYIAYRLIKSSQDLKIAKIDKEKEHELTQTKIRFFTNISHEIRTPLTLIKGYLDELNKQQNRVQWNIPIHVISQNTHKLLMLVNQLLDFRKIENDSLKLSVSQNDLIACIDHVINFFKQTAERQSVSLIFNHTGDSQLVWFDQDKIEKIMFNLLSNSLKFSSAGGAVTISMSLKPNTNYLNLKNVDQVLLLKVEDIGKGINERDLKNIFNRYFQVSSVKNESSQGTGIGLSFVKKLVDVQHGTIEVFSELGEGTRFEIILPATKEHLDESELNDAPQLTLPVLQECFKQDESILKLEEIEIDDYSKPVILIVDDNFEILNYIQGVLKPQFKTLAAVNGQEAVELAREMMPDMILSDVVMPVMDGYELCKEIKSNFSTSHIPVILITAKSSEESKIEGFEYGADAYITKPFEPEVLKRQIKSILSSRQKLKVRFGSEPDISPREVTVNSEDQQFLEQAIHLVESNLKKEEFSTEFLAQELNVSRTLLYRKMKAITSFSANIFIRTIRLKKAAILLENNFGNVSQVCYEVGFNDIKHFRNIFKKQFGVSPSKFKPKKGLE